MPTSVCLACVLLCPTWLAHIDVCTSQRSLLHLFALLFRIRFDLLLSPRYWWMLWEWPIHFAFSICSQRTVRQLVLDLFLCIRSLVTCDVVLCTALCCGIHTSWPLSFGPRLHWNPSRQFWAAWLAGGFRIILHRLHRLHRLFSFLREKSIFPSIVFSEVCHPVWVDRFEAWVILIRLWRISRWSDDFPNGCEATVLAIQNPLRDVCVGHQLE